MFPYEIKPVDEDLQKELMNDFKGEKEGYVQVGPKKWFFPAEYAAHAEKFYTFNVREDDVWVVTYPRTGTTLMQELIWLVVHDLDFEAQAITSLDERFPFFEHCILHGEKFHQELRPLNDFEPEAMRKLAFWHRPVYDMDLPSPRLLKTHIPYSLLPPEVRKKCKSIYIGRNPKDVAVSYYYHNRLLRMFDFKGDFEKYWGYFEKGLGTTFMQELIWLVVHDLDFEAQAKTSLDERFPFFEHCILHGEKFHQELRPLNDFEPEAMRKLAFWHRPVYDMDLPSPRLLKTHIPYSLLPPKVRKKCKSIYIGRNPKDVAVSYYYHNRLLRMFDFKGDFEKYWGYFEKGLVMWSPYWEHLKEGWAERNNPNVLFLFYEDLNKDMKTGIRKVADFLGKKMSEEDIERISDFLHIDNFRNALKLHAVKGVRNDGEQGFVRKGRIGENDEFSNKLSQKADEWIEKNCDLPNFEFPKKF